MDLTKQALTTPRLVLRPWQRVDLDAMARWPPFRDPIDQGWNWPQRMRADGTLDLLFTSHSSDATRAAWTILRQDAVIGLLQLSRIDNATHDSELGIAFGAPWISQGYGREALNGFLDRYFGRGGFRTLSLEVTLANLRAHRLYQRLGFVETSRFWRYAGLSNDYTFLERPAYAALRSYFRHGATGVYQMYAEMRLDATIWHAAQPI